MGDGGTPVGLGSPPHRGCRVALLASGGADSTTMAYWLSHHGVEVVPVFVNYGQHCAETEWTTLTQVLDETLRQRAAHIDISDVYRGSPSRLIQEADLWADEVSAEDLHVPFRNLLLLTVGAAFAETRECESVCAAFINSNHALEIDCSREFFKRLEVMMGKIEVVKIEMPFRDLSKRQVVKLGVDLGVPLGLTYSCQVSANVPCGACPNCVERLEALDGVG